MAAFAIKAEIADPGAASFAFAACRTMYGGKRIAAGDVIFLFGSGRRRDGGRAGPGQGLVARGVVTAAHPHARVPGLARQTPRVSIVVRRTARATRPLGRAELKPLAGQAGHPGAELHFKFYRQATDKIAGISDAAAAFLAGFL